MKIENVFKNEVLDDCGFEALRDYGVQSITVNQDFEPLHSVFMDSVDFGAARIPNGATFDIQLSVDSKQLQRLQEALKNGRTETEELKHEMDTMDKLLKTPGKNIKEKQENYFKEVDSKAVASSKKNKPSAYKLPCRYKIKHR
jgi:hypothetical protein